ncbi:MAG: hypothetical protein LBJ96_05185 [Holosporaceae bacterium]|jgi:hypothetical protein|nr:hypothetical protein [Holosporaceae bacterium]
MKQIVQFIAVVILFLSGFICEARIYIDMSKISWPTLASQDPIYLTAEYCQLGEEERTGLNPSIDKVLGQKNPDKEAAYDLGSKLLEMARKLSEDNDAKQLENPNLSELGVDESKIPTVVKKVIKEDLTKLTNLERALRLAKDSIKFFKKAEKEISEEKIKEANELKKHLEKLIKEEKKKKTTKK